MSGARDITQLGCSPNLAGIVASKIEQSFYSDYSYSGIESIEHAQNVHSILRYSACVLHTYCDIMRNVVILLAASGITRVKKPPVAAAKSLHKTEAYFLNLESIS